MTPRQRRTQQERVDESERRLIEAAAELIAEQGYHQTSIVEICDRAGYSREMVRLRFGSKATLVTSLLQRHYEELLTEPVDRDSGWAHIETGFDRLDAIAAENPALIRAAFLLDLEAPCSVPEAEPAVRDWLSRTEKDFADALGAHMNSAEAAQAARQLLATVIGSAYLHVLGEEAEPARLARLTLEHLKSGRDGMRRR